MISQSIACASAVTVLLKKKQETVQPPAPSERLARRVDRARYRDELTGLRGEVGSATTAADASTTTAADVGTAAVVFRVASSRAGSATSRRRIGAATTARVSAGVLTRVLARVHGGVEFAEFGTATIAGSDEVTFHGSSRARIGRVSGKGFHF